MPTKHNLTKYDRFVESVRDVDKKAEADYTEHDIAVRNIATLVASFSSSNSWNTYKAMQDGSIKNNLEQIIEEYKEARSIKWKNLTVFDVQEIADMRIPRYKIEEWIYYVAGSEKRKEYRDAWNMLDTELSELEEAISAPV